MTRLAGYALAVFAALLVVNPAAGADPERGARVFQRCFACHSVVAGEDNLPGPNLRGVLGRRAGTLAGFTFSPAMVAAGAGGLVWTREILDTFLTDPLRVVPGTAMGMPAGLPSAADRQDVIDFLTQAAPR